MRVGLPLHFVREAKITGLERYALSIAVGIAHAGLAELQLEVLASRTAARNLPLTGLRVSRMPADWRLFGEQAILPLWARRRRLDLLHIPAFGGSILGGVPFVLTLLDTVFWDHPDKLSRLGALYYRPMVERAIRSRWRRATIFLSASARDDALRYFPQLASSAFVGYCATTLEPRATPRCAPTRAEPFRVISVGTLEPRKNLSGMMRAVARFRELLGRPVIWQHAGRRAWIGREESELLESSDVELLGTVNDSELCALYSRADAFLSLSLMEGFNIPLVEAMGQGTPAVVSDLPVHREIGAGGALYVGADAPEDAARALHRLATDADLWLELSAGASARGREFTPTALATRMAEIYRAAA